MNETQIFILKAARKIYANSILTKNLSAPECVDGGDAVSQIIYDALINDKPCMIARFMANEFSCVYNYLGVSRKEKNLISYIKGDSPPWWWNAKIFNQLQLCSGFFPPTEEKIEQYCQLTLLDMPLVDILGSWLPMEHYFDQQFKTAERVKLLYMDPFWTQKPWTKALEGKKVLVVHPFAETIQKQFKKREQLFENNLLPEFELRTIKAVQSSAGSKTNFSDWFEAFDYMKNEIDKIDYEICLIGAGAYGFPLAAHVKRMGKKGFNLGGTTQLLFGIKGQRWENNYNDEYNYPSLFNSHWVRPTEEEKPTNAQCVEDNCYW